MRLACVRRAANVRSEPGSNSPVEFCPLHPKVKKDLTLGDPFIHRGRCRADLTFSSSELFGRSLPLEHSKRVYRRRAFRKPTLESPRLCVRFSFQGPRQRLHRCGLSLRWAPDSTRRLRFVNSFYSAALRRATRSGESSTSCRRVLPRRVSFVNSFSAFVPMCGAKPGACRGRCGERDVGSGAGLYVRVPALGHRGSMLPSAASFVKELRENSSLLGSPDGDEMERS